MNGTLDEDDVNFGQLFDEDSDRNTNSRLNETTEDYEEQINNETLM